MQFPVIDGVIRCPVCDMPMSLTERPHEITVSATHKNNKCSLGNLTFRVSPKTGYGEKTAA